MKKLILGGLLTVALLGHAYAQPTQALVVSSCGTPGVTYAAGQTRLPTVDTSGKLCLNSSGIPPTGAAGGALKGTYPNPSLADVSTVATSLTIGPGSAITSSGAGGALGTAAFVAPGTGVATALGANVGSAGAFVVFNGALGTPSGGVLTNATGLPISTGLTGAGTGVATALGNTAGGAGGFALFNASTQAPPTTSTVNATGHTGGFGANATGTYTTPANVLWIEVKLVAIGGNGGAGGSGGNGGGGAGGAGGCTASVIGNPSATYSFTVGTHGNATTFGTSLLSVAAGGDGTANSGTVGQSAGGDGGSVTIAGNRFKAKGGAGGSGGVGISGIASGDGGVGGASCYGGGGVESNSGNAPGSGGGGGNGGASGGTGADGYIEVVEHYNY